VYFAMNHSALLGNPLHKSTYYAGDSKDDVSGWGLGGLLGTLGLKDKHAVFVHLICPVPGGFYTDTGKATLDVPQHVRWGIQDAAWDAAKTVYREKKAAEKTKVLSDAGYTAPKVDNNDPKKGDLQRAVFKHMEAAVRATGGNGRYEFSNRQLMYKLRPLVRGENAGLELTKGNFPGILTKYQKLHGSLEPRGMYYGPSGHMVEPHSRRTILMGTRNVREYVPTPLEYNKILFVEKRGLEINLKAGNIDRLFDMAPIYSVGYSNTAVRGMLDRLQADENYMIFCLHDADASGYNIYRTLCEETVRMPNHHIEVVDLGLTIQQGLDAELEAEVHHRTSAIPKKIVPRLSALELDWFTGTRDGYRKGKPAWRCRRIELNALGVPELIEFVTRRLEEELNAVGLDYKITPPDEDLARAAATAQHNYLSDWVDGQLDQTGIKDDFVTEMAAAIPDELQADVSALYDRDRTARWSQAPAERVADDYSSPGVPGIFRERFAELMRAYYGEGAER
jgi:hypothetical protein